MMAGANSIDTKISLSALAALNYCCDFYLIVKRNSNSFIPVKLFYIYIPWTNLIVFLPSSFIPTELTTFNFFLTIKISSVK